LEDFTEVNAPYKVSKLIPLATQSDNLLGEYLVVCMSEEYLYVHDENARDAIQRFDRKGNYSGVAVMVGEGPNNLNNISDFLVSDAVLEVLEGMGESSSIHIFNENGQIVKTTKASYLADSFSKLDEGNYVLYRGFNLPLTENRLVKLTPSGEITDVYLPNTYTGSLLPLSEQNFNSSENNLYIHEAFTLAVFMLSDSLETVIQFDFGRYAIPHRYFEMDWMEGFEMINSQGFAFISNYWQSGDLQLIGVHVQVNGEFSRHHLLWNSALEQGTKRICSSTQLPAFQYPIGIVGDKLVFIAQAAHVLELNPAYLPSNGKTIEPDDNPVLVFVALSDI